MHYRVAHDIDETKNNMHDTIHITVKCSVRMKDRWKIIECCVVFCYDVTIAERNTGSDSSVM